METTTYSSNSNNAVLQENGPHRLTSADGSLKGQTIFKYQIHYQQQIIGNQITYSGSKEKTKSELIKIR